MEDSSRKKVARSVLNKIDALPDSVLYKILSFLDMKEVIASSLVSRRWRHLWESVSVLNFVHEIQSPEDNEVSSNNFMNFVDRVLLLRDGSKVNKFKIVGACDDSSRLCTWLTVAARRQFQEVHLDMYANEVIELPDLLFSSPIAVFSLMVDVNSPYSLLEVPVKFPDSFSSSPQLKTLILHNVVLPEGSNGELIFSCPVLENLTLRNCNQTHLSALVISTPQLKSLVIRNATGDDGDDLCHTKIWTPKLVSLEWICFLDNYCSFGNLSNLVNAKIDCIGCGSEANPQNLVKVLDAVSSATTMEVSLAVSGMVHKDMPDKWFSQISNARHLTLHQWDNKTQFLLVLKLLKNAPCVETLVVNAYEMEDFDADIYPVMLCHLKSVKVGKVKEPKNRDKFLKILLKTATVLEELIIEMSYESSVQEKVSLGKKIRSLARASPNLTVIIV